MSSIWVTLLDTSGSMGDGFTAAPGGAANPLADQGAWATKIEAAKEVLLNQIAAIRVPDLAVFEFKDSPTKIFQGTRDQLLANTTAIASLTPGGGTSIAAALAAVEADPSLERYQSLNVLIVSDGLSDRETAEGAANALLRKYPFARIDTILIDDTDEGRPVAEAVSINGSVRPVTSTVQLRAAMASARLSSLQSGLVNLPLLRLQAQREIASFQQLPEPTLLSVTSGQRLTARTLRDDVVPTLLGLEAFGEASSLLAHREYHGTLSSISQDSPISINLTGLKEAVELALNYVIPWRRRNAERLAALDVEKKEIEVQRERFNLSVAGEYDRVQRQLELQRIQLELTKSKVELAERMLQAIDPESSMVRNDREVALGRLLAGVEHMSSTRLEFTVVHDELPRG